MRRTRSPYSYFKTALFSIYLVGFIFCRPWQRLCFLRKKHTHCAPTAQNQLQGQQSDNQVHVPVVCMYMYVYMYVYMYMYIHFLYIIEMSVFSVGKLTLAIENVHIRMNVTSLCTARLCHGLAVHSDVTFTTG